jgi:two-component system response regulator AtoC
MLVRVILAVDDAAIRARYRRLLTQPDVVVEPLKGKDLSWNRIVRSSGDLLVISRALVPSPSAETISSLRGLPDAPEVLIVTQREDAEDRATLLAGGCYAVMGAELPAEVVREALGTILSRRRDQVADRLAMKDAARSPRLSDFVSSSPAMQAFMSVVHRVAASEASLLVLGETGVGKEHLAHAIHAESSRSEGPFVAVNCAALPETLLESELFGHEEGAFTGASRPRRGWFELAHRGTVFLDEICEMPQHLQVRLLRVLQAREVQRLGGEGAIHIDVRVIAATNRDILADVESGRFRRDLYYRLSVVTLTVPPLRDRREDIPAIVDSYISHFSHINRGVVGISPEALESMTQYAWPGNVRELINVVERAMLLCNGDRIGLDDLPANVGESTAAPRERFADALGEIGAIPDTWLKRPLREVCRTVIENFERRYLTALLEATHGRVGETAKRAGIHPRALYGKMKRYGLRKEDFREG